MANIAFKGFSSLSLLWTPELSETPQLYIFHSLGVTIFFLDAAISMSHTVFLLTAEKYSKPQCRLQKWKSKLSRRYISTFPGPLSAMCCVWCWAWPTKLL